MKYETRIIPMPVMNDQGETRIANINPDHVELVIPDNENPETMTVALTGGTGGHYRLCLPEALALHLLRGGDSTYQCPNCPALVTGNRCGTCGELLG